VLALTQRSACDVPGHVCLLLEDCTGQPIFPNSSFGTHEASVVTIETIFGRVTDSSALIAAL
jgi:hypothetical protein